MVRSKCLPSRGKVTKRLPQFLSGSKKHKKLWKGKNGKTKSICSVENLTLGYLFLASVYELRAVCD